MAKSYPALWSSLNIFDDDHDLDQTVLPVGPMAMGQMDKDLGPGDLDLMTSLHALPHDNPAEESIIPENLGTSDTPFRSQPAFAPSRALQPSIEDLDSIVFTDGIVPSQLFSDIGQGDISMFDPFSKFASGCSSWIPSAGIPIIAPWLNRGALPVRPSEELPDFDSTTGDEDLASLFAAFPRTSPPALVASSDPTAQVHETQPAAQQDGLEDLVDMLHTAALEMSSNFLGPFVAAAPSSSTLSHQPISAPYDLHGVTKSSNPPSGGTSSYPRVMPAGDIQIAWKGHEVWTYIPEAMEQPRLGDPRNADVWERLKPVIRNVYLKDNFTVKDVMEYMIKTHDFHATINMYKKRFRRWAWGKYAKRGTQKGPRNSNCSLSKTCRRNPAVRLKTVSLINSADGQVESALSAYKNLWEEFLEHDSPSWKMGVVETYWWQAPGAFAIVTGLWRFRVGDSAAGMKWIENGIRSVSENISSYRQMWAVSGMLCQVIQDMIWSDRWDIVPSFLSHLEKEARGTTSERTLGKTVSGLLKVMRTSPRHILQVISSCHAVEAACMSQHNDKLSPAVLTREGSHMLAQKLTKIRTDRPEWELKQLVMKYDELIQQAELAGDHLTAAGLLGASVEPQRAMRVYLEDYLERTQREMDHLASLNGTGSSGIAWMYQYCLVCIVQYHLDTDNLEAALTVLRRLLQGHYDGELVLPLLLQHLMVSCSSRGIDHVVAELEDIWRNHPDILHMLGQLNDLGESQG